MSTCNTMHITKKLAISLINVFNRNVEHSLNHQIIPVAINYLCLKFYHIEIQVDSKILTDDEKEIFLQLLHEKNYKIGLKWNLLFRGSTDGFTFNSFNGKCTNISNVISIIHSEHNYVFGGFTKMGWPKLTDNYGNLWHTSECNRDNEAFLYKIRCSNRDIVMDKPGIYDIKTSEIDWAVHSCHNYLCCFGKTGMDIALSSDCNINDKSWVNWEKVEGSFNVPNGTFCLNGGHPHFKVKEIEVYQCQ